jgi:hypothetical protein
VEPILAAILLQIQALHQAAVAVDFLDMMDLRILGIAVAAAQGAVGSLVRLILEADYLDQPVLIYMSLLLAEMVAPDKLVLYGLNWKRKCFLKNLKMIFQMDI